MNVYVNLDPEKIDVTEVFRLDDISSRQFFPMSDYLLSTVHRKVLGFRI